MASGGIVRPTSVPRAAPAVPAFRWRRELLRLALELPLIVLGVYLAYLATQYEEAQERARRATQLRAALRREVMDIGAGVVGVHRRLGATLARLDSAVRVGQPLPLQPMLETEAIQPHMWQTAMQSGALDLLDVATVWRLSEFYNELSVGTQQLHRLGELSETVLLPVAGAPAEEFWRPAAGLPSGGPSAAAEPPTGGPPAGAPQPRYRLQPRYQWYTATLGELYETTGTIVAQSDSLARLLAPPGRR